MIRIQNIYYMLAYAFQVLNEDSYKKVAAEEFEYVSDLFSAILAKGMFLICSPEVSLQRKNALKRVMLYFTTGAIRADSQSTDNRPKSVLPKMNLPQEKTKE